MRPNMTEVKERLIVCDDSVQRSSTTPAALIHVSHLTPPNWVEGAVGIKKVDCLLDKIWFKGLIRTGTGREVLKPMVSNF